MKKLFTFIIATLLLSINTHGQSPEKVNYQAMVRGTGDTPLVNTIIGLQISVLQGSTSGSPVYIETQTPTTNAYGVIAIEIGGGTPIVGSFAAIDWSNGPYFLKTEIDIAGGTNYTVTGTSQLLSVPYAQHAKTAANTKPTTILYGNGFVISAIPANAPQFVFFNARVGAGKEPECQFAVTRSGTVKNFMISLARNTIDPGSEVTVTFRVNGTDTAFSKVITSSDPIGTVISDLVTTVDVNQGDLLSFSYSTPIDPGAGTFINITCELE
ncbi:hypothetical protein [uncultured Aquimarina sp.]|uniref:hypothetical protein n=1 Tax=uncultured Aquimarina sp. TaxID=575652 RepID=UPI00262240CC|nr:hypothetical protein [uncultured Aquimarina sp.]